jgi:hypothetical protein
MKAFFWMVVFPLIPLVLGLFAAIGCDLSGVGANGWWELTGGLTIAAYAAATWYGQEKGRRILL